MKRNLLKYAAAAVLALALTTGVKAQSPKQQAVSMYNLGLTAYKQGSPESAIIFFRRATDIDPDLADAQFNLGVIFQQEKRYKDAIARFLEVLRIKPSDPDAHFQLGVIYEESGQHNAARQHFSAIAPDNPHFSEAQNHIAQMNSTTAGTTQPYSPSRQVNGTDNTPASPYNAAGHMPYSAPETNTYTGAQAPAGSQLSYAAGNVQASAGRQPSHGAGYVPGGMQGQPVQPAQAAQGSTVSVEAAPNPVPVLANVTLRKVATGFNAPAGLTFDRLGNLYVANFLSNTVDRISPDGSRTQFSAGANLKGPIGLAADENGNIYVANYTSGSLARITPAGVATVIATGFRKPYYLTIDREGNLYVSQQEDNSIVRVSLPRPIGVKPQ